MKSNNIFLLILCISGYIFLSIFLITITLILFFSNCLETTYNVLIHFYNAYKLLAYLNIIFTILFFIQNLFKFTIFHSKIRINTIIYYVGIFLCIIPIILYLIPIIDTIINY